jgi:hypothetical protein
MRKLTAALAALALIVSGTGSGRAAQQDLLDASVPCAGSSLVIQESRREAGKLTRVTLGKYSAEALDNTIRVRRNNDLILSFEVEKPAGGPKADRADRILALAEHVQTLQELCSMKPADRKLFSNLAALTVLRGFASPEVERRMTQAVRADQATGGFVLIGIYFLLLVIIGAGFGISGGGLGPGPAAQ